MLNQFTNIDLLNDYRLLENIGRAVDGLKKDRKTHKRKLDQGKLPKVWLFTFYTQIHK